MGKPRDFVIAPNPDAARPRLSRLFAGAPVVEFHQIGQMLALPATGRDAPFAPTIDPIGKSHLQDSFLGLIGDLHNTEWERMKIQKQSSVTNKAAAWHMS